MEYPYWSVDASRSPRFRGSRFNIRICGRVVLRKCILLDSAEQSMERPQTRPSRPPSSRRGLKAKPITVTAFVSIVVGLPIGAIVPHMDRVWWVIPIGLVSICSPMVVQWVKNPATEWRLPAATILHAAIVAAILGLAFLLGGAPMVEAAEASSSCWLPVLGLDFDVVPKNSGSCWPATLVPFGVGVLTSGSPLSVVGVAWWKNAMAKL